MHTLKMMTAGAIMIATGIAPAFAGERIAIERKTTMLEHAAEFGFTHFEEIDIKDGDSVDIEGWLDDEWRAEIRFSMADGQSIDEERKRLQSGPWGMTADEVSQALSVAEQEGMVAFEEIEVDKRGMVDIEGVDERGRELEVKLRQGSDTALSVGD